MDEQPYLIAEDLLLLLLDDERGRLIMDPVNVDAGLAGAVLLDLALRGRVSLHKSHADAVAQALRVGDTSATGDDVLDDALGKVAARDRPAADVIEHLAPGLRLRILDRLSKRGIVEHEQGRFLGVIPRHRWPAHDDRHEMGLRAALRESLVNGAVPSERVGALIALLTAIGAEHRVLPFPGISHRRLRARAAELAREPSWAGDLPGIPDVISATRAAIIATTVAASSSSPGGG